MISTLRETAAVTRLNLANLGSRPGPSLIIVVGVAGVVAVLLGLLAMSAGFEASLAKTARPDRVLILRGGSNNEMDGWVNNEQLGILSTYEGLAVTSGEIIVTLRLAERGSGIEVDVAGRGVTGDAFRLRDEVRIVRGRRFEPGTSEVIVGVRAAGRYQGLAIGDEIQARTTRWRVVGHFDAANTAVESEVWLDRSVVQDVFRRTGGASLMRARLAPGSTAAELDKRISTDPRLALAVVPEQSFFAEQTRDRTTLINVFAYFVAGVMAVGSVLAALNTMYVAVSRRTVEIATLRAMGFGGFSVVVSVLAEAMLLALAGGLTAALLVYFALDGYATSTFNNASSTQVAFAFRVTPGLAATGVVWALALGLVGGLLPALRAARMPISRALRGE